MMAASAGGRARLRDLLDGMVLEAGAQVPDVEVTDITADSDRVMPGSLFLACRGQRHHGLEFAEQAVVAGAAAIAWETTAEWSQDKLPASIPCVAMPNLGAEVGVIANRFFAAPSAQLHLTGVTGTNGKTTTAWLASQALTRLGCAAGYMGTIGYGLAGKLKPSALTTPGVILVHRRLREMADAGADAVVMEVSSHGLEQSRIDAVNIRTAAFTNLSREHLDYHGTIADYAAAKARLFTLASLETAVINIGDSFGAELAQRVRGRCEIIAVALADAADAAHATLTAEVLATDQCGLTLRFCSSAHGVNTTAEMQSPLWGRFNAENLLVAAGILLAHGYGLQESAVALAGCTAPPGRMQVIRGGAGAPLVVVDFAHTPDALAQAIGVMREHCAGAVSVVFGCGGERDKGKRGEMGSVAARLANRIIVTDDNPRNEDPQTIAAAIVAGIPAGAEVEIIHDRALAITTAITAAGPTDAVLVAGKGSESFQLLGRQALPFVDADIAAGVLEASA